MPTGSGSDEARVWLRCVCDVPRGRTGMRDGILVGGWGLVIEMEMCWDDGVVFE